MIIVLLSLSTIVSMLPLNQAHATSVTPPINTKPEINADEVEKSQQAPLSNRLVSYVTEGHVIGISYAVWHRGQQVYYHDAGLISQSSQKPVDKDTIFRIYSMTKPITAVAMMILHERGVWEFDDPIEKHLPAFSDVKVLANIKDGQHVLVSPKTKPTMLQLMTHTAGFGYGLDEIGPVEKYYKTQRILESQTHQTLIDKIAIAPLAFEPGTDWRYSISSDIQGALIEKWTGMTLGQFLKKEIFDPLGMSDTDFIVPDAKIHRFSDVFAFPLGQQKLATSRNQNDRFTADSVTRHKGGGGLVSTQEDFAKFLLMMRRLGWVGNKKLVKAKAIQDIQRPHLPENIGMWRGLYPNQDSQRGHNFGLGLGVVTDPEAANLPFGKNTIYWSGIAGTWFWFDIENDVFAIGMMQRYNSPYVKQIDFARETAELTYRRLEIGR